MPEEASSSSASSSAAPYGSSPSKVTRMEFPKDCKACAGAQHLLDAFSKYSKQGQHDRSKAESTASSGTPEQSSRTYSTGEAALSASNKPDIRHAENEEYHAPKISSSGLECPPDSAQLGRSTWTFLHTMAAYYPDQPTDQQQALMRTMINGLAEFYPCQICAEHLRAQVQEQPPKVTSSKDLSMWLCGIHNEVNELLGKQMFDCSKVFERWRDGPSDGSCD